jgi:hypothetical protein
MQAAREAEHAQEIPYSKIDPRGFALLSSDGEDGDEDERSDRNAEQQFTPREHPQFRFRFVR